MNSLFENCYSLTEQVARDIANWRTPSLQKMAYAFRNTRKFTKLDLHNWQKDQPAIGLTNMYGAFAGSNATYLNLSGWHLPASDDGSETTRGIFDHLGQGQPILIVMEGVTVSPGGSFNLKDNNASTSPIDRSNSDLPLGPVVIIASDQNGNLAIKHNGVAITDANNHWSANKIRFMTSVPQNQDDWQNWQLAHADETDPDYELNNLRFAFTSEAEARNYLLGQLRNYLTNHHLTDQLAHFTGHSTYYHLVGQLYSREHGWQLVGRAKNYDPKWLGEGQNNPGPGTGDDYEYMRTDLVQAEKVTDPLTMSADNVRTALQNDQHTWADNFLPMLFSGIYFAEPIPEVTVTVQYKDIDTGQIVKTDPAISGHPGDSITLTFNIPAGYHEVAPEPSTSYTFANTNGLVTVLVQRDAQPTPTPQPKPNPDPIPEPQPRPHTDIPYKPDTKPDETPENRPSNKPQPRKNEQQKTSQTKVMAKKVVVRTNVQKATKKSAPVAKATLPQTSDSKLAAILGSILSLAALIGLGFGAKKRKN